MSKLMFLEDKNSITSNDESFEYSDDFVIYGKDIPFKNETKTKLKEIDYLNKIVISNTLDKIIFYIDVNDLIEKKLIKRINKK